MVSIQSLMQEAKVVPRNGRRPHARTRTEERAAFAAALDTLPETTRLALALRCYEAFKPAAIAVVLGLEEDQVRELLAQGLAAVQGRLDAAHEVRSRDTTPVPGSRDPHPLRPRRPGLAG